jgi:hypothetical protein
MPSGTFFCFSSQGVFIMRVTPARAALAAAATVGVFAAVSNAAGTGVSGLAAHRSPTREAPVLEWKRVRGVVGYRVVRDGHVLGRVTTTSFTDRALTASGLHTYVVRGVKPDGTLTSGERVDVIVDALLPKSMADRPSADSLTAAPQISWNAVGDRGLAGIRQYNVRRDGVWIGSVKADVLTFVDEKAPEGTHQYIVRAEDFAGNRADEFSPAVTVTTGARLRMHRGSRDTACCETASRSPPLTPRSWSTRRRPGTTATASSPSIAPETSRSPRRPPR